MTIQEADRAVRDAWVAGLIAVASTVLLTFIYATGAGLAHIDWFNVVDLLILGGLTFAIYKHVRYSATAMLIYYLAVKSVFWFDERAFIGLPIALIFAYFFWRGARGLAVLWQETAVSLAGE